MCCYLFISFICKFLLNYSNLTIASKFCNYFYLIMNNITHIILYGMLLSPSTAHASSSTPVPHLRTISLQPKFLTYRNIPSSTPPTSLLLSTTPFTNSEGVHAISRPQHHFRGWRDPIKPTQHPTPVHCTFTPNCYLAKATHSPVPSVHALCRHTFTCKPPFLPTNTFSPPC